MTHKPTDQSFGNTYLSVNTVCYRHCGSNVDILNSFVFNPWQAIE